MSRAIAISNAAHDGATDYLDIWTKKILDKAAQYPDVEVHELKGKSANRSELEQLLKDKEPRLVILHGHGTEDSVYGHIDEILIKADENPEVLSGKIAHALSCLTGQQLANRCIEVGTIAYVGYKQNYKFLGNGSIPPADRLNDSLAARFLDSAFEIDIALIEGVSIHEAFIRSQNKYRANITEIMANFDPSWIDTVGSLYHDLINQMYVGDGAAIF